MYFNEIFEPIYDFYYMRKNKYKELFFLVILPVVLGVGIFLLENYVILNINEQLVVFSNDIIGQLITVLALFISFSMGYLSILLTSSSQNIDDLKKTDSKEYRVKSGKCTLYQVNINEISYLVLIEIFFLILVFFQKFIVTFAGNILIKVLLCLDISLFIHVLLVLIFVIKDIYFSFWRSI